MSVGDEYSAKFKETTIGKEKGDGERSMVATSN